MGPKTKPPAVRYPDPAPPPPERTDAETEVLAEEQRSRFGRGGRASTLLTGGQGTTGASYAVRTLGGASGSGV